MLHQLKVWLGLGVALILAGCATPVEMWKGEAALGKDPVLLLTADLKNAYKPDWVPEVIVVHVEKPDAKESSERLNFRMDEKAKQYEDIKTGARYVFRMPLPEGQYVVRGITGQSARFPIRGMFFLPIHADITVKGNGVVYLGHMTAETRERKDNEFRAGPPIPLIDQAVSGYSSTTWDISIADRLEQDRLFLTSRFPGLRTETIQKMIIPFDRAKAQAWWEAN